MKPIYRRALAVLAFVSIGVSFGAWFAVSTWDAMKNHANAVVLSEQLKLIRMGQTKTAEQMTDQLLSLAVDAAKPPSLFGFKLPYPSDHDQTFLREKLSRDRAIEQGEKKISALN